MMGDKRHIIVLDYPGRRAEAGIAALDLESQGFIPQYLLSRHLPVEPEADRYTASLYAHATPGGEVAAVMAYCAAGALAGVYAELVRAASGERPPVICFDAEPCTVRDLVECYAEALRQIPEDPDGAPSPPVDVASLIHQPRLLVGTVREDLTRRMLRALVSDGLRRADVESAVTRSVDIHLSWLTHLLACFDASTSRRGGIAFHVQSKGNADLGRWSVGEQAATVRIDSSRSDLLRHPETRSAVLSFLRENIQTDRGDRQWPSGR